MTKRRTMPTAGAAFAALALLAAGCSSGAGQQATRPHSAPHQARAAVDHSGLEPGGPAVAGADGEAATLNPAYTRGSKVIAFQVRGYSAQIDIRSLPSTGAAKQSRIEAPGPHPVAEGTASADGPIQTKPPQGTAPRLKVNVAGLDYASWGAGHPPDTSGAVGPSNFVQTVNTSIGVYDKAGVQLNAFTFNTFFSQFNTGTPCDNVNGGDPQVIFDRPSNKWIVADLSYPGPYYYCMAVSDGPNITDNKWTLYPYKASNTELNDYPKMASGPDGIYVTANMFTLPSSFDGAQIWAYKRSSLGTGSLKVQTVRTSNQYGSLLPANSYQATESQGPEYLTSLETTTALGFWKYTVDWANPNQSTFTQTPKLITVDGFTTAHAVPELGGAPLDTLSDRPMYQLQLSKNTLWMNHSVQAGTPAGVRWYQIGNLTGNPTVLQQRTFAPSDGLSRWMGSLAVDKNGNMAIGYNTSSSTTYPSIHYATRLSTDRKNRLTAEGRIVKGTGAQQGITRWGDYSQMSIDPADGCTFWYTGEYYAVNGGDWQTRIASFKFPGCS